MHNQYLDIENCVSICFCRHLSRLLCVCVCSCAHDATVSILTIFLSRYRYAKVIVYMLNHHLLSLSLRIFFPLSICRVLLFHSLLFRCVYLFVYADILCGAVRSFETILSSINSFHHMPYSCVCVPFGLSLSLCLSVPTKCLNIFRTI